MFNKLVIMRAAQVPDLDQSKTRTERKNLDSNNNSPVFTFRIILSVAVGTDTSVTDTNSTQLQPNYN